MVLRMYLGDRHGPDFLDVNHAVVPGHQALHVDVQLVPQSQDGLVVLLDPRRHKGKTRQSPGFQILTQTRNPAMLTPCIKN